MREERAPEDAPLAIESPSNPRIKAAVRLRERRERESTGLTLVDGGREALRAIEAGAVVESAFLCPPLLATVEARRVAEKLGQSFEPYGAPIDLVEVSERAFARLAYGDRADGVVLVVKGYDTPREMVRRARDQLLMARVHLLGAVINNVDTRWGDGVFYGRYYAGYYGPRPAVGSGEAG